MIRNKIWISIFFCLVLAAPSAPKNEACSAIAEELGVTAPKTTQSPMQFVEYVRLASADFNPAEKGIHNQEPPGSIPVPLAKGLDHEQLKALLASPTAAVRDATPADWPFPLLVLGQGLYYESPLSHLVLWEFLASHGYVVATCPLAGTHYRLVNLSVEDLETEIRDLEFVIAQARQLSHVHPVALGIIGYDLGGMAGLVLTMRHPDVKAFISCKSLHLTMEFFLLTPCSVSGKRFADIGALLKRIQNPFTRRFVVML